ncbi:MAG: DinB family protein [Bryobacteraceae bacterium]|nr:DinB family protein [Bryobacteraceae bacterium]
MQNVGELLERFRRGGELVAMATTGAAGPELDFKPSPDRWSVRQIVCHLADSEQVGAMRFRQTLAEDNPTIQWYDEAAWAEKLDYARRKISQAVETFRRARSENFELIKELPEEAWSRPAMHSKYGPTTLGGLLENYAKHAEGHVMQIREVRAAYKASRASQQAAG